jgi:hypothetical protein
MKINRLVTFVILATFFLSSVFVPLHQPPVKAQTSNDNVLVMDGSQYVEHFLPKTNGQVLPESDNSLYLMQAHPEPPETVEFWVYDSKKDPKEPEAWKLVQATKQVSLSCNGCYVYIQNGLSVSQNKIKEIGEATNNSIHKLKTEYSADFPQRDGFFRYNSDIFVLITEIPEPACPGLTIAGYFYGNDQTDDEHSNKMNLIYINPKAANLKYTIAHELTHLLNFNYDIFEEKWVKEGLAQYSEYMVFPESINSNNFSAFESKSNTTLTWTDYPVGGACDDTSAYYAVANLFFHYLSEKHGGTKTIGSILKDPEPGIAGISKYLSSYSFEEVFTNWAVANLLDDDSVSPLYKYDAFDIKVNPVEMISTWEGNASFKRSPKAWTVDYLKIIYLNPLLGDFHQKGIFWGDKDSRFSLFAVDDNKIRQAILQHPTGYDWTGNIYMHIPRNITAYTHYIVPRSGTSGSGDYWINSSISSHSEAAIGWGLDYLRNRQYANGSWSGNVGITSLATIGFMNAGYRENDPTVQKAIEFIRSSRRSDNSFCRDCGHVTYETALAIVALKGTRNSLYNEEIRLAGEWLRDSQWDDDNTWGTVPINHSYWGGFGYGRNSQPDLSNTQFAVLGLHAAGVFDDDTKEKVIKYTSRCQNRTASNDGYSSNNDGGFNYLPGQSVYSGTVSIGSTTGAGMWTMALSGVKADDPRFKASLDWVKDHYSWDHNPTSIGNWGGNALYYYYLSMSKALSMARVQKIGGGVFGIGAKDWYKDLSNKLLGLQRDNGSWVNQYGWVMESVPELTTAYAILSLQTRKLPADADLEMVIILHSPADLHLYDEYGRHVGKNYSSGGTDLEIPGSSYQVDEPQTISIKPPVAGNYHLELVGTGTGYWRLEVIGYQDGIEVSYESYSGTITEGAIRATDLNVGAFEGGLTIYSSQPQAAPVMVIEPTTVVISGRPGDTVEKPVIIREDFGDDPIQSIGLFASDLFASSGSTISGDTITFNPNDFDLASGGSQEVNIVISIPQETPYGQYSGVITAESLNAGAKSIQVLLEINATNEAPILTVPGDQFVQYSDPLSFSISATDPYDADNSLSFSATDLPNGFIITNNGDGTATVSGIAQITPGFYTSQVTVTDPGGLTDTKPINIVVTQEDARYIYTGPMMVSTSSTSVSTATIPLRATVQDITAVDPVSDPNAGDITKATVTFVNRDNGNAPLCTASLKLLDPTDLTTASAACEWMVDIGNNSGVDYTVGMVVGGNYIRDNSEDDTVVVVSKPDTNFITGGGYLINQSSYGVYKGHNGAKTNFGLNLKFNKKLTAIQGQVNIIVRQDGKTYQIKSNQLSSLVVVPYKESDPNSGTAELLAKASIQDITDPYNPISLVGGTTLQVAMKDRGEPGTADSIGIIVWSSSGELLFSSNWRKTKTYQQILDGGNIQIH